MNRTVITSLLLLLGFVTLRGQRTNAPIDFNKARQLMERRQRGETLTSDERAYLERANDERRKQQGSPANQRLPPERARTASLAFGTSRSMEPAECRPDKPPRLILLKSSPPWAILPV